MAYTKRLGVFVRVPQPGKVKTRLVPPLSDEEACRLYTAFMRDLFARLGRLKKVRGTVFYAGDDPSGLGDLIPNSYEVIPQASGSLGVRLDAAFRALLPEGEESTALVIGSDSPDVPIQYIKRAFLKLKHKDVVVGPACDGGYYLIGLKSPEPSLFEGIEWGGRRVFEQTLERVRRGELGLSLMPMWYDVDTPASLGVLSNMIRARQIERSGRLPATEAVLEELRPRGS